MLLLLKSEISTKYMRAEQQTGNASNATINARCRLCKAAHEGIILIIASCPMSVRYYLPICHDFIAKTVFNSLTSTKSIILKKIFRKPRIYSEGNLEHWWNISINTATNIQHNKPNSILWDRN